METYHGHVRTPADAIILFEACRTGLLPRVQRRLSEKERQSIKSGSVFVWDEREAGMRRWTDGKSWSASRVSGSFLTYREMEGKRGGGFDKNSHRESLHVGDAEAEGSPDGYRYKVDGLIKQSFSITTSSNQNLHLISYFSRSSSQSHNLPQPSSDPQLRHIRAEKGMYPESTVHEQSNIPAVTRGPMSSPHYAPPTSQPPYASAPYPHPPNTAWAPPSPVHTPPANYATYGYNHGHHQSHMQHTAYSQASPLQHVHYPPPPPSQYQQQSNQTAFDRPPSHMQNSSLPPPPPPQHQYGPPPYPTSYQPSYGTYPHSGQHQYPPPPSSSHATSPYHAAPIRHPASAEGLTPHIEADHRSGDRLSRTPPGSYHERTPSGSRKPASSTAQTIPSISSMLNGADSGAARPSSLRSNSRSPNAMQLRGPSDIPTHKIGFETNRDMEALRSLDKTTFKGY